MAPELATERASAQILYQLFFYWAYRLSTAASTFRSTFRGSRLILGPYALYWSLLAVTTKEGGAES